MITNYSLGQCRFCSPVRQSSMASPRRNLMLRETGEHGVVSNRLNHMKTIATFPHRSLLQILSVALFLLASVIPLMASTRGSRPPVALPAGACNLPPVPAPGQTVTWTLAGSPYEICQNITIPSSSTVIVEAGVHVTFDPDMQVIVLGTMELQGQAAQHIVLQAPAVFPPIIDIDGGVFNAAFSDLAGQVRVENGANVALSDCAFQGNNAVLWAQELPTTPPFIQIERCTFTSASAFITDALSVLEDNVFNNTTFSLLRGFADVTATNTFTNSQFSLDRQESFQPFYLNGVHASNNPVAGLVLSGGNYSVGMNTILQNNLYPVALQGGLLPESA